MLNSERFIVKMCFLFLMKDNFCILASIEGFSNLKLDFFGVKNIKNQLEIQLFK